MTVSRPRFVVETGVFPLMINGERGFIWEDGLNGLFFDSYTEDGIVERTLRRRRGKGQKRNLRIGVFVFSEGRVLGRVARERRREGEGQGEKMIGLTNWERYKVTREMELTGHGAYC